MKILYNSIFLGHDTGEHPENKNRLIAFGKLPETVIEDGTDYLSLVHTVDYIEKVKEVCQKSTSLDSDTICGPGSFEAAVAAAGATVMASKTGDFALVRPPGHHAHRDSAAGFCLFNNMAIAAARLVSLGKRVLIFDFDGHLGDGTEQFFYSSNQVLYWSIHQFPAYPGGGTVDEIGQDAGKGYTINVPLPPGSGDDVYKLVVEKLLPVAVQFAPDAVGVSAGFDGYKDDPLLSLNLSASIYYWLGEQLSRKFSLVFAALEGGYNTKMLPSCLYNFIAGVNHETIPFAEEETKSDEYVSSKFYRSLQQLVDNLSLFWRL